MSSIIITDTATATESVSIFKLYDILGVLDSAIGTDSIFIGGRAFSVLDRAYAEDRISIVRFNAPSPPSGAISLTGQDTDYITLSYHQMIDTIGMPITYKIQNIVGHDTYEHPIIEYTKITMNAFITIFTNVEYEYTDPGFLPNHYASMWVYQAQPQVGDHVLWQGIEWEVRNSIPKVIGSQTVYYQVVLRRILSTGTEFSPSLASGTLQSGGVLEPPTGDP